jgi:hypothetical protein
LTIKDTAAALGVAPSTIHRSSTVRSAAAIRHCNGAAREGDFVYPRER